MGRKAKYTEEELREAVATEDSIAGVLRRLGLKQGGGAQANMIRKIKALNLNDDHMTGQLWSKGKMCINDTRVPSKIPIDQIFVNNSSASKVLVRKILLNDGRGSKCEICGIESWNGQPLTFEMDHINGLRMDHRLENLRFICPNCHSQTPTFRNKQGSARYARAQSIDEQFIIDNIPKSRNVREFVSKFGIGRNSSNYQKIYETIHRLGLQFALTVNEMGKCDKCGNSMHKSSKTCMKCSNNGKEKIEWPTHSELIAMVESSSFLAVGKALGVSDNAVRKRLKMHKE